MSSGFGVVQRSSPVDGFSLAYDRTAAEPPVILLHGWPDLRGRAERTPEPAERIAPAQRASCGPANDPLFPPDWADRLDAYFAQATVTRMPDAGHFSPLEAPQAFATAIRDVTPCTTR